MCALMRHIMFASILFSIALTDDDLTTNAFRHPLVWVMFCNQRSIICQRDFKILKSRMRQLSILNRSI